MKEPCHLRYWLQKADEMGIEYHPQKVMESLGINYIHATPQSMGDQWWFWNCRNIPDPLPEYLQILELGNPKDYIGWGLSEEDAEKIIKDES